MNKMTVLLSSTFRDLSDFRSPLIEAINRTGSFEVCAMESFGAQNSDPVKFCKKQVSDADILVGIYAQYRGTEVEKDRLNRSITEIEYDTAVKLKKPRLIFVAPDNFKTDFSLLGTPEQQARQKRFLERVLKDRVVSRDFSSPHNLVTNVLIGLLNLYPIRAFA